MSKSLQIYGLGHCSTVQKARAELEAAGWQIAFRDVAREPLQAGEWQALLADFGDKLVNRASLTWRAMSEAERSQPPMAMLAAKPALMKRPAILQGENRLLGWTANVKRALGVPA